MRSRGYHNRLYVAKTERKRLRIGLSFPNKLAGSVHMVALGVLLAVFAAGGGYLYSVNRTAVQGYQMRALEKEIHALKQENAELKIAEADLRSLYRIEASGEELDMHKLENVVYLERHDPASLVSIR